MRRSLQRKIAVFEGKKIRRYWDEENEKWWFSVVDVVAALSSQIDFTRARKYWNKLAERLRKEGSEVVTKCHQLKMQASDGKFYLTDAADTETMLRIIQSIPSPNAEPFKLWLAKVGYERIEEAADPEIAIQRAMHFYLKRGYSKEWVSQRLKSIEIRKELIDEWETRGVKTSNEFGALTDEITFAWAGLKTREYKKYKRLKKENLRDNMTNLELVLNMLAEASTTEISKNVEPKTFAENRTVAKQGGSIAGSARRTLEKRTGKRVVSQLDAKGLNLLK
ncbi:antirepressor [Candidatus Gottesmanbacteria bacterium RIFCSPHIGHO2_01_FULL_46_14]|uniref:Antirepressor n=2 Tax=Candidatus Gottesmaniibacteriota TaxID=1752720 RepID=A0A1F5ZJG7_9BACT|nr:MAG: antirepressor [Candidatus Gottesmanbacteria bacterium RIFCSPHIGHO2_01_FULL_46_14]OGG29645.1 MAG: antirepressor [Candidatus Gottesmanbacteria bacterium RIFCSPLOWO2_01_FULL_46_21]